jgi:hypothetical protein
MTFDAPSRLLNTSLGDKVAALSQFIGKNLDARAAAPRAAGDYYLLIARSPDSPVAQALRVHTATMSALGLRVRAIFSEAEQGRAAGALNTEPFSLEDCRLIRDQRLLAAHEQLVLGPECAWIGDSMRRDPGKRDAFVRYAMQCPQTAMQAARSFDRMWRVSVPFDALATMPAALAPPMPDYVGTPPPRPEALRRQS